MRNNFFGTPVCVRMVSGPKKPNSEQPLIKPFKPFSKKEQDNRTVSTFLNTPIDPQGGRSGGDPLTQVCLRVTHGDSRALISHHGLIGPLEARGTHFLETKILLRPTLMVNTQWIKYIHILQGKIGGVMGASLGASRGGLTLRPKFSAPGLAP